MIALKILPLIHLFLVLFAKLTSSYPTYSRYYKHHDPYDYYPRGQDLGYYPQQYYPEEYYYNQEALPLYYISPRKYDIYPSGYYYPDLSKYYETENEKLIQDMEREQREMAQPIGHEIKYENDDFDEETNAAFLNNLMMQQMYQSYYDPDGKFLKQWNDMPYDRTVNFEDEDVKALQDLPKKQKSGKNKQQKQKQQRRQKVPDSNNYEDWSRSKKMSDLNDVTIFTERKPNIKNDIEKPMKRTRLGQSEQFMMRPATPVTHPFSQSMEDYMKMSKEKQRSPSVYDKIRHMLEMEKNEEGENVIDEVKPQMRKRIVSSEDSLTRQLTVLKKAQ